MLLNWENFDQLSTISYQNSHGMNHELDEVPTTVSISKHQIDPKDNLFNLLNSPRQRNQISLITSPV